MPKKTTEQLLVYREWQKFFYGIFQEHNFVIGVYGIQNTLDSRIYVGVTRTPMGGRRWPSHLDDLARRRHHCSHLQRAWYQHGYEAFKFIVLRDLSHFKNCLTANELEDYSYQQESYEAREHPKLYNSFMPDALQRMTRETGIMANKALRKRLAEDPVFASEYSAALSSATTESWKDPDIRDRRIKGLLKAFADPEHSRKMKTALTTPSARKKRFATESDPLFKESRREAARKGWIKRKMAETDDPKLKKQRDQDLTLKLGIASRRPETMKKRSDNAIAQNKRQRELELLDPILKQKNFDIRSKAIREGKRKAKEKNNEPI